MGFSELQVCLYLYSTLCTFRNVHKISIYNNVFILYKHEKCTYLGLQSLYIFICGICVYFSSMNIQLNYLTLYTLIIIICFYIQLFLKISLIIMSMWPYIGLVVTERYIWQSLVAPHRYIASCTC